MQARIAGVGVLLVAFAGQALAQMSILGAGSTSPATFKPPPQISRPLPAIVGAPFSGEEASESMLVVPDGRSSSSDPRRQQVFRDSQGRTRREWAMRVGSPAQAAVWVPMAEIIDPVRRLGYILDVKRRVAHRVKLPEFRTAQPRPLPQAPTGTPSPIQDLGQQVIDGEMAEGQKLTMQSGVQNDGQPLLRTTETWRLPDLGVILLTKMHDQLGDRTTRLTNLKRGEPDPKLFEIPPDYAVVDETGAFVIEYATP